MLRLLILAALLCAGWLYLTGSPHLRVIRAATGGGGAQPFLGAEAGGAVGGSALGAARRIGN